jgi:hypothetical protein
MLCRSGSGTLHVSPRLASIYMRIVDIIDMEEDLSAEDARPGSLARRGISPHQPAG